MKVINSLRLSSELRYKFAYNIWGYEIAGNVCKEVWGKSWDSMLHSIFFSPLGMTRSDTRCQSVTLLSGSTLMGPAGGVQSCIDDLLILYQSMLKACISQFENDETSTPEDPFKQLTKRMSAYTPLPGCSLRESSYGMG